MVQEILKKEIKKIKLTMKFLFISISFLIIFTGIFLILKAETIKEEEVVNEENKEEIKEELEEVKEKLEEVKETEEKTTEEVVNEIYRFDTIKLKARSAVVWDMNQEKILFEKNSKDSLPLASITKIMTAIVANEKAKSDLTITMDPYFMEQQGQSGLLINEIWYLKDLIEIIMLTSANDGAYAIASTVGSQVLDGKDPEDGVRRFVSEMNKKAKEIGLSKTFFNNPTGLDINELSAGAYGSANDVVKMTSYVYLNHPEIVRSTKYDSIEKISVNNHRHHFTNTNLSVHNIKNLAASKTGYTDLAGGNLVVVIDADFNYPVIIVVMGSTFYGRFEETEKLIEATYNHLHSS